MHRFARRLPVLALVFGSGAATVAIATPEITATSAAPATTAAADPAATYQVGTVAGAGGFETPGQLVAVGQAELAAQASGRITEVRVRSGDAVRSGQVLLRIDAPAARAGAQASVAQSGAADAQLASARADFERATRLHEKHYLSDAALQRAQAQLRAVEAQAAAAAAQARAAREVAGWEELRAPYDGWVTAVRVAAGDLAQPGQPLVAVYAPGPMRAVADVPEDIARDLVTDQPVRLAYPAGTCASAPAEMPSWTLVPAVDARSRSVGVRVELPALRDCVPGVLVRLSLPTRAGRQSLSVPRSALLRRGELDAVYVMTADGRAQLRQVRLGEAHADAVEVLAGLEPGERVLREAARYQPPTVPGSAP